MAVEAGVTRIPLPTVPANLPPEVRKWAIELTRALDRAFTLRFGRLTPVSLEGLVALLNASDGDLNRLLDARDRIGAITPTEVSDAD